jgi:hypothetical protein
VVISVIFALLGQNQFLPFKFSYPLITKSQMSSQGVEDVEVGLVDHAYDNGKSEDIATEVLRKASIQQQTELEQQEVSGSHSPKVRSRGNSAQRDSIHHDAHQGALRSRGNSTEARIRTHSTGESPMRDMARGRALTYSPMAPENAPSVLSWKDLTVTTNVGGTSKVLLNNLTGTITGR